MRDILLYFGRLGKRLFLHFFPPPQHVVTLGQILIPAGPLQGRSLLLDTATQVDWQLEMQAGQFDSFIYDKLSEIGGLSGKIVWDVGAHIGYHTLALACEVGKSGHVVAFEPNPHNRARFQANIQLNPDLGERVTLLASALSDYDGNIRFVFSADVDGGGSSASHLAQIQSIEHDAVYATFEDAVIAVFRADSLLAQGTISVPQLIKIDVEGAEYLVLRGATSLLATFKPVLLIEVHSVTMMFCVQRLLTDLGYRAEILDSPISSTSRCFLIAYAAKSAATDSPAESTLGNL